MRSLLKRPALIRFFDACSIDSVCEIDIAFLRKDVAILRKLLFDAFLPEKSTK